jgi:transformation/transcription domain-associated protein
VRASKQESDAWEDRWIACAKRLHQWDVLVDFARSQNNVDLLAECAIKVPDWNLMRETITKLPTQDSHIIKLYQGYLAISDNIADVDALSVQGMHIALKKWSTFPDVSFPAHVPLLQYFQQILELQESAQIVKELSSVARHQSVPDLKSALNIWRERLPNRWEDVTAWNDVMTWRQHVFHLINTAFKPLADVNPSLAFIGHHETAWTINKFSHVARKHQLVEVCLNSLSKIYTLPNIEIQDAFVKLREQIKCYFQLSTHYRTGLDIINSTNLDYFDPNQKAEFFQLKGEFHHRMGNKEEANLALSTCLSLSENFAKGWVCWAYFCDHQFGETDPKDPARMTYAENAVNCYMQAVRTHTIHGNKYLSRVLWLVTYCANTDGNDAVFSAVEKASSVLPPWIWIMWIPQLLASLRRHEFQNTAISILQKIAATFPQALHYPLRAFIAEIDLLLQYQTHKNRGNANNSEANGQNSNSSNDVVMTDLTFNENTVESLQMCVNRARELLHHLHNSHPTLIGTIELMMNGIATCAKTDPIHALYSSLRSIVHECFKVPSNETPPNVFEMLHSIFVYFSTSSHPSLDPLRPSFEKELLSNEIKGASFMEVIEKIKSWSARLLTKPEMLLPKNLNLENISAYLLDFHTNNTVNTSIEMPGQYTGEKEPSPEQHAVIERFLPEVTHVQENGIWTRVITIVGNNGRAFPFTMHTHNSATQQTHRSTQLLRLLNSVLVRHRETSKRGINFVSIPCIFSVSPKVWLVHQPATRDFESLEDVKIAECYHDPSGSDPDAAIMYYKQRIIENAAGTNKATKLQIYRDITKQQSPDNILTKYMQRKHANYAQLFEVRKYLASQLALHSLVGYILGSIPKSPENIRFSKSTGALLPWNISLLHQSSQFNLESLPFRLTPNMRAFLGPNLIEGSFIPSMVAASMCFAEAKEQLHNFLNLHTYNNHIMTWWNDVKTQESTLSLVLEQVNHMMTRVHSLTPPLQPDKKLYVLPMYKKVSDLVSAATNPQNLCQMDAVWQPWL